MEFTYKKLKRGRLGGFKPEDTELLAFLWKWKLASSNLLRRMLFPNLSKKSIWKKFNKLERVGLIECQYDFEKNYVAWSLTAKGLQTLYLAREELKQNSNQEGFASENPRHDFLVTAFHIGDFAFARPKNIELVSEQQLRRLHEDFLPDGVPSTSVHRPDGYTMVTKGDKKSIVAIEVELSQKNEEAYSKTFRFYSERPDVQTVLWMVGNTYIMARMKRILASRRILYPEKHNFILLNDFIVSQWNAKIISGTQTGHTIRQYLWGLSGDMPSQFEGILRGYNGYLTLLKPIKTVID